MTNSLITSFGQGNITPIQKPKKVLGPPANVRPVTCVTCPRKLLSVIIIILYKNIFRTSLMSTQEQHSVLIREEEVVVTSSGLYE